MVPCVDHSSVGLEVENTVCLVRGSRQTPGGDHGFLQCAWHRASLGNSQLDNSQTVANSFTASADLRLSLPLADTSMSYSVLALGWLPSTSAVFSVE